MNPETRFADCGCKPPYGSGPSNSFVFIRPSCARNVTFTLCSRAKPGPKGSSSAVIEAILELKGRSPTFGCPRIALIVNRPFGLELNKDVVRRVIREALPARIRRRTVLALVSKGTEKRTFRFPYSQTDERTVYG